MLLEKIKSKFNMLFGMSFKHKGNDLNKIIPESDFFKIRYQNSEILFDEKKNLNYFHASVYTRTDEKTVVQILEATPFFEVKSIFDITDLSPDVDENEMCFEVVLYFLKETE